MSMQAMFPRWWVTWFLLALIGFSIGYWVFTSLLLRYRQQRKRVLYQGTLPSVVFLRPVKRGVPQLAEKAGRLIAAARPGDWVVFVVDTPEDEAACRTACRWACEGVYAEVLMAPQLTGVWNPKIAKLITLTASLGNHAPEHWILSDCEAVPDPAFMDRFRREWAALEAACPTALLTAGYRFTGATRFFQQLDQFPSLLTLWPGLVVTEWANGGRKGLGYTLGACTGLRKRDLQMIGGWESMLTYLAEDHRLGAELARAGHPTYLSREVLSLDSDPLGLIDWIRHQHRVSFTYRVCNPAGFLGMGLIQGATAGVALVLLNPAAWWSWSVLAILFLARAVTALINAVSLGYRVRHPARFGVMSFLASVVETAFWASAWLPLPVRWGRRTLKVGRDGQFSGTKGEFDQTSLASEGSFHYQSDA